MEKSVRARAKEKREAYANIVARHLVHESSIDESELALRLVSDLEWVHLEILHEAVNAPKSAGGFQTVSLRKEEDDPIDRQPLNLHAHLQHWPYPMLNSAASELVGKGLLRDVGLNPRGQWVGKSIFPMELLSPTETAHWIHFWLIDPVAVDFASRQET